MFERTIQYRWMIVLLALSLTLAVAGCENDDDGVIDPVGDENTPALMQPDDGAEIDLKTGHIELQWAGEDNAVAYHVQINADPTFVSAPLIEAELDTVVFEPQVNQLIPNNTHYWRVASRLDDGSLSDYSRGWAFEPTVESDIAGAIVLNGEILEDMTLTTGNDYLLRGGVFVGYDDGNDREVELTIEPGVTIYGESATDGMLVIRRSGKINAQGTSTNPIVFTSDRPDGSRDRGDWGGVIINGEASLNTGVPAFGEGDTGPYGGTRDDDNSGTLRYVRIEFAGREISPDNELNGLALQGVGSGTTIEFVQVHMNQDDGVEFFGGTVNARYMYVTGCADDQFDWTDGWRGKGQFWICQQYADDADQGIEADNNGDENTATPYSAPTLYNLTLVGAKTATGNDESDIGILLREGTRASIHNSIVTYFGDSGFDIDGDVTFGHASSGHLELSHCFFFDNEATVADDDDGIDELAFLEDGDAMNWLGTDPMLTAPYAMLSPMFTLESGSPAMNPDAMATPGDGWFMNVDFIGAMGSDNWLADWTTDDRD